MHSDLQSQPLSTYMPKKYMEMFPIFHQITAKGLNANGYYYVKEGISKLLKLLEMTKFGINM